MTAEAPATERLCELAARADRFEVCTEECPLWENGRCSLEAILEPDEDDDELD